MFQEFNYLAPQTRSDLFSILNIHGESAKIFAGGTDLLLEIRSGKIAPSVLVDLKKIQEFDRIVFTKKWLSIGPSVTCNEVMANKFVQSKYPLIAQAASQIGSHQVRNRATIIGNLCTASPSSDMAPILLCLESCLEIASAKGVKIVPLKDFFLGVKKTILKENEIVQKIIIPSSMAKIPGGFQKLKRIKGHDLAIASVALVRIKDSLRIAIGACSTTPLLLPDFPINTSIEKISKKAIEAIAPIDDVRASKDYRAFMVSIQIQRLIKEIFEK